jgi:hypothetical protein
MFIIQHVVLWKQRELEIQDIGFWFIGFPLAQNYFYLFPKYGINADYTTPDGALALAARRNVPVR